jgi:hypothetical protein
MKIDWESDSVFRHWITYIQEWPAKGFTFTDCVGEAGRTKETKRNISIELREPIMRLYLSKIVKKLGRQDLT